MFIVEANNEKKEFLIIEPSFYDLLNYCNDLAIKCLEVLRRKLPTHFTDFPDGTEYGLIRSRDFLENEYPAIGIQCKSKKDYLKILDSTDLLDEVEILINQIGIEKIKKDADSVNTIQWDRLKEVGWHFEN